MTAKTMGKSPASKTRSTSESVYVINATLRFEWTTNSVAGPRISKYSEDRIKAQVDDTVSDLHFMGYLKPRFKILDIKPMYEPGTRYCQVTDLERIPRSSPARVRGLITLKCEVKARSPKEAVDLFEKRVKYIASNACGSCVVEVL